MTNGCPQSVGTAVTPFGSFSGVATAAVLQNGAYVASSSPGANVFQGIVGGNTVVFNGIPMLQPTSSGIGPGVGVGGLERVFRIVNIRANAAGANVGGLGFVTASISISSSFSIPITNATITAGFVQQGLVSTVRNTSNTAALAVTPQPVTASEGAGSAILQFSENFATAFKNQYGRTQGAELPTNQNFPGQVYNSESGFVLPGLTSGSTGYTAGQADCGTRLKALFTNVPSGVSIWVSTRDINNTFTTVFPVGMVLAANPNAVLVSGENTPSGGSVPTVSATGSSGLSSLIQLPVGPVAITGGSGSAVWEVVQQNPSALDTFNFAVYLTSSAPQSLPSGGPISVTMSFGPTPTGGQFTAGSAASLNFTLPRFSDALDVTSTVATIAPSAVAPLLRPSPAPPGTQPSLPPSAPRVTPTLPVTSY